MENSSLFLSKAVGYLIPYGALYDPESRKGLFSVVMESFRYGTSAYPDQAELFYELENTGAVLSSSTGFEGSFLFLVVPRENFNKAKDLLEEIFQHTQLTQENLEKIIKTQEMAIDEEKSNDISNARNRFTELTLGIGSRLGHKSDLKNITLDEVNDLLVAIRNSAVYMEMDSPESFIVQGQFTRDQLEPASLPLSKERFSYIPKDIPQKVVILGHKIKGDLVYDFFKRRVAQYLVSGSWNGLAFERIREQHSAAYFAAGASIMLKNTGSYGIFAGVSEENVIKSFTLMQEIFDDLKKGNFEDKLISIAKETFITDIAQLYDSLSDSYLTTGGYLIKEMSTYKYKEAVKKIESVTKNDVIEFFKDVTSTDPYMVVLGDVMKQTEADAKSLIL